MRGIAICLILALMAPWSARAAFPGDNGPVVYARDGGIYSASPKGAEETRLADGANPAWSPDGSRIAYSCEGQICVMDADGSNAEQVTLDPTFRSQHPAWSPDGEWIVFHRREPVNLDREPAQLFKIRPDGSEETDLDETGNDPAWSPDGKSIIFTKGLQGGPIYAMSPEGSDVKVLFDRNFYTHGLTWAPDGKHIAFLLQYRDFWRVWKMRSDGTNAREIFRGRSRLQDGGPSNEEVMGRGLAWSPNGRTILYLNALKSSLCRISPKGERKGCLGLYGQRPDWAPEGGA